MDTLHGLLTPSYLVSTRSRFLGIMLRVFRRLRYTKHGRCPGGDRSSSARMPVFAVMSQLFEVEVVNNHGFHIRIAFGSDGVPGKLDVRRREDPGLGVVDVGVLDERQIARTAGDRHVKMVLDAPRLGTVPDSQITVTCIRVERYENDLRPLSARRSASIRGTRCRSKSESQSARNRFRTPRHRRPDSRPTISARSGVMWILYCLPIEPSRRNR